MTFCRREKDSVDWQWWCFHLQSHDTHSPSSVRQTDRQWHCSHSPSFKQSAQTDRETDSGTAVTVRHSNSPHRQTDRQTNSGTAEVACFNHNISHSSGMTCIYDHSHCSHLPAKGSICKWNEPLLLGQKSITTLWLVPNYTARSQRHACVM